MMNIEVMGGVSADHVQGLVELKIVAPDELRSQATEIRLSVAGKTIEQRLPVSSSPISFTLVSHRIPNGTQILECLLLDESNRVLSRSQTDLKIDNSRGIGPKISKELSTREFPIFLNGDLGDELFPAHDESHEIAAPLAGDTDAFREFYEKGFFIAEKLLPDSLTDLASGELDQAVEMGWDGYKLGSSQRMHNMHLKFEGVEKIWLHPEILRKLELFLGAEPMLCQTLTYINGSEQDLHQDTIHLSSFPRGSMIGVWVALEDVQPGSGELEYIV
ncbi:MAG: phytanoyl-CoA dioxygenase family protein, partial [Bdellovibrionota bacterium]